MALFRFIKAFVQSSQQLIKRYENELFRDWNVNGKPAVSFGPGTQAFYNPQTGCWPNRDPIDEPGFNLIQTTAKAARNPQMDQLLQIGLQSIRNKDRAVFLNWLEELAARQNAKQEPYNEPTIEDRLEASANTYAFNQNDGVDRVDDLGLHDYKFYYPCPNPVCQLCNGPQLCTIWLTTESRFPRHPFYLAACVQDGVKVMNAGCAVCSSTVFRVGCGIAAECFREYW